MKMGFHVVIGLIVLLLAIQLNIIHWLWKQLLDILKPGGRYVTAGAIAGPIVNLDIRTLYLKDLTFYGCTYQPLEIFKNLIKYIESNEIKPLIAKTFPLEKIVDAQKEFLSKKFIGKIVLEI